MRVERFIDIDAHCERVWEVLSDLTAWPERVEAVELAEVLTPGPVAVGSQLRLRQRDLPEGTWEITSWQPPICFDLRQRSNGMTIVVGHQIEALGDDRTRLTLSFHMRGLVSIVAGPLSKRMTLRHLESEANDLKRAIEAPL